MRPIRSLLAIASIATAVSMPIGARALAEPATGNVVDGIACDRAEGAVFHIHPHLTVLDHGRALAIPDDVGRPVVGECLYWLHTHTSDGIIHIESPKFSTFLLGQFFDIWGQPLSPTNVAGIHLKRGALRVFVDGSRYTGDPRHIELAQHTDIVLEAGAPYRKPTPFTAWGGQ